MVTVAATVASTWALDLVAAVAGVALVATPALDGASRGIVLGFLAATYVLWVAGLRTNLVANWRLLEETGTSTNALSKLLFDVARVRSDNQRAVRAASVIGYVVTELAKEVPYYAGAFGAVLLSDAIDATDALVFLGGANIGAAIYEYGLARLTRSFLDGRSRRIARRLLDAEPGPSYASFETDWVPQQYLHDYYRAVEPDEQATITFFVEALRHAEPGEPVLLFGVGPTLHHVFLAAPAASEIHLAEYLPTNLQEIERWLIGETGAHDWRPFVEYTLACEGRGRTDLGSGQRPGGTHAGKDHRAAPRRRQQARRSRRPWFAALRHGHQRLLRRLGHRRCRDLGDVHAQHRRSGAAGWPLRDRGAAPLDRLRRR